MAARRLSVCCVVSIRVCASPPPKRARTDPAAFPSGLLLAPFNVSPAPRGPDATFVPDLSNLGVAPLARRADFHLATVKDCTADFHSLSTSWRGVGLGFAPSNDNERISTPRPWGIAAKFVPKSAKGFRSPTGAALIHPLSAHRIICGLPSGSGETRRLAKHPSGRLRRCPSGSAYSKTERGSFPTKQACRKTVALGFPPPAGVSP